MENVVNNKLYTVNNLKETAKLAKQFARKLNGGEVILFAGDLGAGKTTFIKEIVRNLGFKGIVNSPTFTLMNRYIAKKYIINHFDFYRLEESSESQNIGLDDYIYNRDINAVTLIEWPEKVMEQLKGDFVFVSISKTGETAREFFIRYVKL